MKRIFFLCAALLSILASEAQESSYSQYFGSNTTATLVRGRLVVDSMFYLPGPVFFTPRKAGAVRYTSTDSTTEVWSGYQWLKIGKSYTAGYGTFLNNNAFSVNMTQIGDSLPTFYKKDGTIATNRNVWLNGKYLSLNDHSYTAKFSRINTLLQHDNGTQSARFEANTDSTGNAGYVSLQATSSSESADLLVSANGSNAEGHLVAGGSWFVAKKGYANIGNSSEVGITVYTSGTNLYGPNGDIKFDNYDSTRNNGTTSKAFYVGADGNLKYGTIGTSYTDAQARAAIRLTATGTSGAATYDSTTGTINVPNYSLNPWSGLANTASVFGTTATLSTQTGYSFSGSAPATWTLPSLASNPNRWYFLKNRGTATVTVVRAGSDSLYTTAGVTSFTLDPGEYAVVWGDALKWNVHKSSTLPTVSTLTDAATVTWDYSTQGTEAKVTLAGNRTLSITNLPSGKVVYLTLNVTQDATGSRTITLPAGTKVIGGGAGAVTLTTTGGATDLLTFRWNGTTLYCNIGKNYN